MSNRIRVSPGFCFALATLLLLVPFPWLTAMVIAAVFHEICHYVAIRHCGGDTNSFRLYAFGARLSLPPMSRGRELLCTLAGPAGSLLLCAGIRWFPRVAICAACHLMYNLLPIYPMDGGRALQCVLSVLLPPPVVRLTMKAMEWTVCFLLFALGCYAWIGLQAGVLPVLIAILVIFRCFYGNIPCKPTRMGVQ